MIRRKCFFAYHYLKKDRTCRAAGKNDGSEKAVKTVFGVFERGRAFGIRGQREETLRESCARRKTRGKYD